MMIFLIKIFKIKKVKFSKEREKMMIFLIKIFKIKKVKFFKERENFFYCFTYKMTTRQLYIKDRTYYLYNDLINVLHFEASNLKLDKRTWKDIDVYYIGYVDKDKPSDWKVNSVNPIYLVINKVHGSISEKNGVKYLSVDKSDSVLKNYDQVFSGIKYHIRKISDEEVN